ncbi:MAG: LytTR family transcriptional regulator, partial [Flavobacteriaceae bacterium]
MKKSTSLIQKSLILCVLALIVNHLTDIDNFPFSSSYSFPAFSIMVTLLIGTLILLITELTFRWFKKNHFSNQLDIRLITYFFLTSLGFIILLYIPLYFLVNWLVGEDFEIYHLFVGLSITLLLSFIVIGLLYAKDIYELHKLDTISSKLIIKKGGEKILI